MNTTYLEFQFIVNPKEPGTEILIAELGFAGFESFVETEEGVLAYVQIDEWQEEMMEDIQILSSNEFKIEYTQREIAQVNWNEEWEKNFEPIIVDSTCAVRAPFHRPFEVPFEIIIEPKMSFGTGHHETTFLMLQYILENNFEDKSVLDMGCGTAVLAILAKMKGAGKVDAIDIDDWCVENSMENVSRNNCGSIRVLLGDASILPQLPVYDTVIANINRNILLTDMVIYAGCLRKGGELYLSGFYKEDLSVISECGNKLGLQFVDYKEKNNWISVKFVN
jgi:ribosomal protein L11 methyltransferase